MKASSSASSPSSAADGLNAMQVLQNAATGQPANDGPMIGGGFDDAMSAYPSLGDTVTAADMRDPASGQYPLAIQGLLGDGVSAQPYTDALSQLNFDPAPPQPDSSPSLSDAIAAPDMRDPANDDYPLAIQGLLGDGVSAQPYTDALSQLSLNTAPPPPDLHVVRPGETVSGIAHGDYAKIAAIVQANDFKVAADGSRIVRPGDLLLIPNTSGLDPVARRYQVTQGRNIVAAETQGRAQARAAQAAAQNANLKLLDRIDPPLSTPWNTWGAPDFSTGRLFTSDAAPGKTIAPTAAQIFGAEDPRTDLQPQPAGQHDFVDSDGQHYVITNDASGSEIKLDNRQNEYWQHVREENDRAVGNSTLGSIFYTYPKYMFHASTATANLLSGLADDAEGMAAGVSTRSPYYGTKYVPRVEEDEWTRPVGWRLPVSNGRWTGEPGDSDWISTNPAVNAVTGGKAIPFRRGYPDFSQWGMGTYKFNDLTGNYDDFPKVYDAYAKDQGLPNRTTGQRWLNALKLTPHHVHDGATVQLVPQALHKDIPHLGGAFGLRYGGWNDE